MDNFVDVFTLYGRYTRKIIKFCKNISPFLYLGPEDQLRILKPFHAEIVSIRTAFLFNPKLDGFFIILVYFVVKTLIYDNTWEWIGSQIAADSFETLFGTLFIEQCSTCCDQKKSAAICDLTTFNAYSYLEWMGEKSCICPNGCLSQIWSIWSWNLLSQFSCNVKYHSWGWYNFVQFGKLSVI